MRFTTLTILLLCLNSGLFAQSKVTYTIKADSVKITNCDSSELIIENHTQNVPGFLFNTGKGRTIFQRGAQQLGNGMYLIGADTLRLAPNAWLQGGNSFGSTGILGTLDSNHLDLYTSGAGRARITDTGNFIIGDTVDHGQKLQVNGASYFNGGQYITGTANLPNQTAFSWFNPIINPFPGGYASGAAFTPTFNANADGEWLPALQIVPVYNLGSYNQQTDGITPAVYINSKLGGIMLDQEDSYPGDTGEPLFINQGGNSNKPAILNYRNGNATQTPFIWSNDNRPSTYLGTIIPAMANTVGDSVLPGEGISYAFGRFDFGYEASISMQYENEAASNVNINTSIAFNTHTGANGSITPMYINGANIGMGTNIPSAKLQVAGTENAPTGGNPANGILISSTLNATDGSSTLNGLAISPTFNKNGYGNIATYGLNILNGDAQFANGAIFDTDGSSSRLFSPNPIEYQSNADSGVQHLFFEGIGTPNPFSGTVVKIAGYGAAPTATMLQVLGTNDTAVLSAGAAGNVGIGTNTPTAQLHTTGGVRFAGLTEDDTQNKVLVSDASGNLFYRSASSLAANEPVRSSLAVNGPIKAKRIIVSPDEWADYVFDSTYNLKPIANLETYIRKEHHLPGIPSAAQVQKDGLDVGAGQAVLLKKIEELTLYSIGQDKKIQSLEQEVDELKKLIYAGLKNK